MFVKKKMQLLFLKFKYFVSLVSMTARIKVFPNQSDRHTHKLPAVQNTVSQNYNKSRQAVRVLGPEIKIIEYFITGHY